MYLLGVNQTSKFSRKEHQRIVFLLSFPSTSQDILEALYQVYGEKLVICYTKNSTELAGKYALKNCETYSIDRYDILLKKIVPYVTGASVILCDNYFAFLAGIIFRKDAKVIQLWHANGAIKKFGLEAQYVKNSSVKNQKRYKKVYQAFTHYVVSSHNMKRVFERSFHRKINSLNFGYPQTDAYQNSEWMVRVREDFKERFPTDKPVLLYAPTYRENQDLKISQVLNTLKGLSNEWLVMIKMHPHDEKRYMIDENIKEVIVDLKGMELSELLPSIDCLVTDYSSIPFEYTLANPQGKLIFYCYDYQIYQDEVGIETKVITEAPGELATDEKKLLAAINSKKVHSFTDFNRKWNEYVTGESKKQLIEWVKKYNV